MAKNWTIDDIPNLLDVFMIGIWAGVGDRPRPLYRTKRGDWLTGKGELTSNHFIRHHAQKKVYGGRFGKLPRVVVFDLDAHNLTDKATIGARLDRVVSTIKAVLNVPPTIIRSPSGGYHVYVMIDAFIPLYMLSNQAKLWAATHLSGITAMDVFPDGQKGLRLPLGEGQTLLDTDTLAPVTDRSEAVLYFCTHLAKNQASASSFLTVEQMQELRLLDPEGQTDKFLIDLAASIEYKNTDKKPRRRRQRGESIANHVSAEFLVEPLAAHVYGQPWVDHVKELLAGKCENGSLGPWNTIRQICTLLYVSRAQSAVSTVEAVRGWANKVGLEPGSAAATALSRIDYLQTQDHHRGRPSASTIFGQSGKAKNLAPALLDGCIDAIVNKFPAGRVADACRSWLDAVAERGVANDDHAGVAGTLTVDGKRVRLGQYARSILVDAGYLTRIKGHCAGKSKAIYGVHFGNVAALRADLGLSEVAPMTSDAPPAIQVIEEAFSVDVVNVEEVNAITIGQALVDEAVKAKLIASDADRKAMTDLLLHGWTQRESDLPTIERNGRFLLDFRRVRNVRCGLGLQPLTVRKSV